MEGMKAFAVGRQGLFCAEKEIGRCLESGVSDDGSRFV